MTKRNRSVLIIGIYILISALLWTVVERYLMNFFLDSGLDYNTAEIFTVIVIIAIFVSITLFLPKMIPK